MKMDMESVDIQPKEIKDYDHSVVEGTTSDKKAVKSVDATSSANSSVSNDNTDDGDNTSKVPGKEPTKNTIDSAFSDMNSKISMQRTRCEYAFDEPTNRISIKVFDKDTDELIREVPPEESLEVLQKVWELAGLIVDEKL